MDAFYSRPKWLNWQLNKQTRSRHVPIRLQVLLVVSFVASSYLFLHFAFALAQTNIVPKPSGSVESTELRGIHPVSKLVATARYEHRNRAEKQSRSLAEAVKRYKHETRISPPPHFDKWYAFAQEHQVPLIDEFDDISAYLRPFWAFSPAAIRRQVATAINADEFIIGIYIRNGTVTLTDRGEEWRQTAIKAAVEQFAHLLPDMDLAFNRHDEPRVVIPMIK